MDNTTDRTLEDLHKDVFQDYLPVIITLIFLAVIGVVGNAVTIKYYMSKDTRKPVIWLILSLAKTDFCVCLLLFAAAAELSVNILFRSAILCKIIYFLDYAIIYTSIMILALVSVDRYRKICKPFGTQVSLKFSKCAVLAQVITAFLISSRAWVTYDVVEITFVNVSRQTVVGYQCETTDAEYFAFAVGFFHYFDTVTVGAIFVVFVIAYSLILRALVIHREKVKGNGDATQRAGVETKADKEDKSEDELSIQTECRSNDNITKENRSGKEKAAENVEGNLQTPESLTTGSEMPDYRLEYANTRTAVATEYTGESSVVSASFDTFNTALSVDEFGKCHLDLTNGKVGDTLDKAVRDPDVIDVAMIHAVDGTENSKINEAEKEEHRPSSSLKTNDGNINETDNRGKGQSATNHPCSHDQTNENSNNVKPSSNARRAIRIKKYEIRTTVMMLFVSVGFLLSFTPYFIASIGIMYSSSIENDTPKAVMKASTHMMQKCAFLNSVINPFVYYIFNNDFRTFVRSMYSRKCF